MGDEHNVLTDGTGVSPNTRMKLIKDFVADALMGAGAALVAVNVVSVDVALAQQAMAATAVANALISAAYRAILRWTQS